MFAVVFNEVKYKMGSYKELVYYFSICKMLIPQGCPLMCFLSHSMTSTGACFFLSPCIVDIGEGFIQQKTSFQN